LSTSLGSDEASFIVFSDIEININFLCSLKAEDLVEQAFQPLLKDLKKMKNNFKHNDICSEIRNRLVSIQKKRRDAFLKASTNSFCPLICFVN